MYDEHHYYSRFTDKKSEVHLLPLYVNLKITGYWSKYCFRAQVQLDPVVTHQGLYLENIFAVLLV